MPEYDYTAQAKLDDAEFITITEFLAATRKELPFIVDIKQHEMREIVINGETYPILPTFEYIADNGRSYYFPQPLGKRAYIHTVEVAVAILSEWYNR